MEPFSKIYLLHSPQIQLCAIFQDFIIIKNKVQTDNAFIPLNNGYQTVKTMHCNGAI